jgi:hypothetical protein
MTDNELKVIYRDACSGKGFEPSDGQFKVWKQTLGWIEKQDLEAALTAWYGSETSFPMPAELKPLAMQAKQCRETQAAQPVDYVRRLCPVCGHSTTGYSPPSDREPRICQTSYTPLSLRHKGAPSSLPSGEHCDGIMEEVERRPAYIGKATE